ncbi:hypothetical protein [Actinomadura sp. 21ATH]|uniref:hypothetical protein n=1 Tax=Actinomadura sp. 21ATH TaxID=1735444 RepID=UPI0035C0D3F6
MVEAGTDRARPGPPTTADHFRDRDSYRASAVLAAGNGYAEVRLHGRWVKAPVSP